MKNRYRVFRRGWGTYYCEDLVTKQQTTLKTRDKDEAFRLVAARNETEDAPAFSLHLASVYWKAGDPEAAKRTWQHVMDEIPKLKPATRSTAGTQPSKTRRLIPFANSLCWKPRPSIF
jgi:hypothetical protein